MVPSFTGAPGNNQKHTEAVPIQKQEKITQACYIKIGLETSLDQLVTL